MPWEASDAERHTAKADTPKKQQQWAAVANSALERCLMSKGASVTDAQRKACEANAIRQASAIVAKSEEQEPGGPAQCICPGCGHTIAKERGVPCRSVECPECGAKMIAKAEGDEMNGEMRLDADYYIELAAQAVEIAIAGFKGGTPEMKETADEAGKNVPTIAVRMLRTIEAELDEAKKMKTVGGEKFPASDFLVVEKPDNPSTWHLQVKRNGVPDHGLMGGAKAALTSPGGHRGNKYEGPDKTEAITKLKALYKSEGMSWSDQEKKKAKAELAFGEDGELLIEVTGDLRDKARQVEDAFDAAYAPDTRWRDGSPARYSTRSVFEGDPDMGDSVLVTDRDDGRLYAVTYQRGEEGITFSARMEWREVQLTYRFVAAGTPAAAKPAPPAAGQEVPADGETAELEEMEFNEAGGDGVSVAITGRVLAVTEVGDVATGGTKPLKLDVVPVRPGWGNQRDNNYYGEKALRRAGPLFRKVKMYETNHVDAETNSRNWVSTIIDTPRFTEASEPVSVVGVHDPTFAQKVLNLNELGLLEMMECSIRGHGKVRKAPFEQGGRKGKFVEELTDISSVDWVSKAGAGGRALGLAENDTGGARMEDQKKVKAGEQEESAKGAGAGTETVPLGEENPGQGGGDTKLAEAQVTEMLAAVALPEHTKKLLAAREYADEEELDTVIGGIVAEFKDAIGSGKPVATRGKAATQPPAGPDSRAVEAAKDRVNARILGTRVRG
jgi:hypothetical protein